MKDFENDLIYYHNPDPIEEPRFILNSVEELEKSTKYSVICNGTERVVYHTDSFDYVIVVDDEAYDLEISIHTPFEKLAIRPTSFEIVPSVTGKTVQIHLDEPKKFTVETDGGLHDALFVFCSTTISAPVFTSPIAYAAWISSPIVRSVIRSSICLLLSKGIRFDNIFFSPSCSSARRSSGWKMTSTPVIATTLSC